jgi:branched-chain amino acid transport system substrate-binding protein
MSTRARSLVAIVVLSALALAACGSRASDKGGTSSGPQPTAAAGNTKSDTGVTPTEIKIGSIAGLTSGLGPDTFSASLYGAQAYFDALNAKGGVNGRTVKLIKCDDAGDGQKNVGCVRKLVDQDKVFALAGVTAYQYSGAQYLNSKRVPDIGGQPVSNAYDQYPHLYSLYGSYYPRTGAKPGFNGQLYAGTETYRWFKEKLGARTAAVVYYNVAPSQRYAQSNIAGLRREGYTVVEEQINLGAPNWDAAVQDMKRRGVQIVFDAMEDNGNTQLCNAIQTQGLRITAKVTTAQGWTDAAARVYGSSPNCLNALYATSNTRNYNDTGVPAVSDFRAAVQQYVPDRAGKLNMWMLEGYASAQWLTDAMQSCGANLTRACVETYLNRTVDYDGHGLLTSAGRNFEKLAQPPATDHNCLSVSRWVGGTGGKWVSQGDMNTTCYDVPNLPYSAD